MYFDVCSVDLHRPLAIRKMKKNKMCEIARGQAILNSVERALFFFNRILVYVLADRVPQTQPIARVRSTLNAQMEDKRGHMPVH